MPDVITDNRRRELEEDKRLRAAAAQQEEVSVEFSAEFRIPLRFHPQPLIATRGGKAGKMSNSSTGRVVRSTKGLA